METHYATPQQSARMAAFVQRRRVRRNLSAVDRYLNAIDRAHRLFATHPKSCAKVERLAWNRYCRHNPIIT